MRTADKFCDLAGFDPEREEAVVYAHDGSRVTLIEIDGIRSIVSGEDYLVNIVARIPLYYRRPVPYLYSDFAAVLTT